MSWEWAMKRARYLSVLFGCRYRVYGDPEEIGLIGTSERFHIWVYRVERIEP